MTLWNLLWREIRWYHFQFLASNPATARILELTSSTALIEEIRVHVLLYPVPSSALHHLFFFALKSLLGFLTVYRPR